MNLGVLSYQILLAMGFWRTRAVYYFQLDLVHIVRKPSPSDCIQWYSAFSYAPSAYFGLNCPLLASSHAIVPVRTKCDYGREKYQTDSFPRLFITTLIQSVTSVQFFFTLVTRHCCWSVLDLVFSHSLSLSTSSRWIIGSVIDVNMVFITCEMSANWLQTFWAAGARSGRTAPGKVVARQKLRGVRGRPHQDPFSSRSYGPNTVAKMVDAMA